MKFVKSMIDMCQNIFQALKKSDHEGVECSYPEKNEKSNLVAVAEVQSKIDELKSKYK